MNRLLFIGNGFDIAHNKYTKYMDFLYTCAKLTNNNFDYTIPKDYEEKLKYTTTLFISTYKHDDDFIKDISNNIWINYFYTCSKENWVDFENEIKSLCDTKSFYEHCSHEDQLNFYNEYQEKYKRPIFKSDNFDFIDIDTLTKHLNQLIEILNKYLLIVDQMECNCYSPNVLWFAPTNVISFNYTNTFKNIYFKDMDENNYIDFIHGRIDENKNNIVLGFNKMNDDNYTVEYSDFLKIYQRVNKNVEIHNFNRFSYNVDSKSYSTKHTYSMFFGHSLDITDENIIKEAIRISCKVYILYYDERHKASMIKNLLKMYSRDEFEDLCLSYNHKIVFIKQQPMCKVLDSNMINNYFKNIRFEADEGLIDYIKSKEFEDLNLSSENYAYLYNKLERTYNEDEANRKSIEEYLYNKYEENFDKDRYVVALIKHERKEGEYYE